MELDFPMQKHITDIQRDMSTINEQFLFDIIPNSEELTFSIFDRAKDYGSNSVFFLSLFFLIILCIPQKEINLIVQSLFIILKHLRILQKNNLVELTRNYLTDSLDH